MGSCLGAHSLCGVGASCGGFRGFGRDSKPHVNLHILSKLLKVGCIGVYIGNIMGSPRAMLGVQTIAHRS